MNGVQPSWNYPVFKNSQTVAVKDENKAMLMGCVLANVHSSFSLKDEERLEREATEKQINSLGKCGGQ